MQDTEDGGKLEWEMGRDWGGIGGDDVPELGHFLQCLVLGGGNCKPRFGDLVDFRSCKPGDPPQPITFPNFHNTVNRVHRLGYDGRLPMQGRGEHVIASSRHCFRVSPPDTV